MHHLTQKIASNEEVYYQMIHDLIGPANSLVGLVKLINEENDQLIKGDLIKLLEQQNENFKSIIQRSSDIIKYKNNIFYDPTLEDTGFLLHNSIKNLIDLLRYITSSNVIKFDIKDFYNSVFHAPKSLVESILQNIIENAIKYSQNENPEIRITLSPREMGVCITIKDNGIGMSKEIKQRIFDPNYRGTTQAYGAGMGLHWVYESIRSLGGSISVASKPNEGSTFTIYIPDQLNRKSLDASF